MIELAGISASPGIAIGKVFVHVDEAPVIPRYRIDTRRLPDEMSRFRAAVEKATAEIHRLKEHATDIDGAEQAAFLESHVLMLNDPEFALTIETKLHEQRTNVEWVLINARQEMVEKMNALDDEYLRERIADIQDVSRRILNHLLYREKTSLADLTEEIVLVAHDLLPSDAIVMNKRMVKGIAMDAGGRTSHTAILARAFEIPAVLGLSEVTRLARMGDTIIVDGNRGHVIHEPDAAATKRYLRVQREWRKHEVKLMDLNDLPAETRDGKLITLNANIEIPDEVESIATHGADGIGLYRSEFLFLRPGNLPTEEEQYRAYSYVLENIGDKPVTIRTLDIGGDKVSPDLEALGEKNPILGWRAIRYCLSHVDIFKTQLRALLRASVHGALRIMFPMISGVEELERAYEVLDQVRSQLTAEGVPYARDIPVGIMIEVPSAAMTSDILATRADFFSIGTNDLIQYTIAVDRGNENIAYLYEPCHPAVLRLIQLVIRNAHDVGIPVGMCGEMAGDPNVTMILLGLGLDEFSMSAASIPEVKRIIRSVSLSEGEDVVGIAMEMKSYTEIDAYVREYMQRRFGTEVFAS